MSHVTLETKCGEGAKAKDIDLNFLIMDALSPYNIILGWPSINVFVSVISTMSLVLKYPRLGGQVGIVRGDKQIAQKCYQSSMATKSEELSLVGVPIF